MKKLSLVLILIFVGCLVGFSQPTPREIQKEIYEDMILTFDEIHNYRVSDDYQIKLKLDSVEYGGNHVKGYFSTVKNQKFGKIKIKKNTVFTFDGGDATVVVHRSYLSNYSSKILDTKIDLKKKKIEFVLL